MSLSAAELLSLLGNTVEGRHEQLGVVTGQLRQIDVRLYLAAIADPRFEHSPVLKHKDGLLWVDIATVKPLSSNDPQQTHGRDRDE